MTTIYTTIINNVLSLLNSVDKINKVYPYPASQIDKYPAVVFYPYDTETSFETTSENMEEINFKLWVVIGVTQTSVHKVFTDYLPGAVDGVRNEMAENWDGGSIEGHRVSYILNSGRWALSETDKGLEAVAELNLKIKLLTNN